MNHKEYFSDSTLFKLPEIIRENFSSLNLRFSKVYQAGEMINGLFDELLRREIEFKTGELWEKCSKMMVVGTYESWVFAYVLTGAGFSDIGLMALRRSIEFICYLSKICNSNERAQLWMNQLNQKDARIKFAGSFKIPDAYFKNKHEHLKYLLVAYDLASSYASHANFDMLSQKRVEMKDINEIALSFTDKKTDVPRNLGYIMLNGSRLIAALLKIFDKSIKRNPNFINSIKNLEKMVKEARLEVANFKYNGNIPRDIVKGINDNDTSLMEKQYQELVSRLKAKKKKM